MSQFLLFEWPDYLINIIISVFRYKIIYLSSRAIGLSDKTKKYLKSIKQGVKHLPEGPVLLSPVSVLMAFKR